MASFVNKTVNHGFVCGDFEALSDDESLKKLFDVVVLTLPC
jgi:hypothetical protein